MCNEHRQGEHPVEFGCAQAGCRLGRGLLQSVLCPIQFGDPLVVDPQGSLAR